MPEWPREKTWDPSQSYQHPTRRTIENGVDQQPGVRRGGLTDTLLDTFFPRPPAFYKKWIPDLELGEGEEEVLEFAAADDAAIGAAGMLLAPEVAIPVAVAGAAAYAANAQARSGTNSDVLDEKGQEWPSSYADDAIARAAATSTRIGGGARQGPLFPGRIGGIDKSQVTGRVATTIQMDPPPAAVPAAAPAMPETLPPYFRASTASVQAAPKFETHDQPPSSGLATTNTFATPHVPTAKAWWWDPLVIPVVPSSQGEFVDTVERQILNRLPLSLSKHVDASKFVQYKDAVVRARMPVSTLDAIWTDTSADGPRIRRAHWLAMTGGR